jgi:GNAT superfamily N-acetyltransferase
VIRVATPADRDAVVATVVAAFVRDPALRHFFPRDDRYEEQATAFVGYLFDLRVPHGTVWVHGEHVEATALWSPPTSRPPAGGADGALAAMRRVIGDGAAARIDAYATATTALVPDVARHWYLGILATRPEHRGRGLARQLMAVGLERVDDDVAYLETTNRRNVEFYRSAGWQVVATSDGTAPLPIWVLAHDGEAGGP